MNRQLPASWVEKIFARLLGIYGRQFSDKFSRMVGNVDAGMENAKQVWAEELAGFGDQPDAIAYALKNLDPRFPPSALEFRELCRHAPRKEAPSLPYKPSVEDIERQREMANSASAAVSVAKVKDGIDQSWATHPRSHAHLRAIFSAANSDRRFLPCVQKMVDDGICSADGQAFRFYRGAGEWIGA